MKERGTIFKGSLWTLINQALNKLISFAYTIIIARLLLEEQIGMFYLVLSILSIIYLFTDLGLISSISRYVPYLYGKKEFRKLKNLVRLSYFAGGATTFVFSILIFFFSEGIADILNEPTIKPILELMAIWLFIKEIDDINRGILTGRKKVKEAQILLVLQNFIKLILTLIAFYIIGFNVEALSLGFLISFILVVPIGAYYAIKEMKDWKEDAEELTFYEQISFGKEIIAFGVVITILDTFGKVVQHTDKLMIAYFIENSLNQIAVYSIATGLANLTLIFSAAIGIIFLPVISELYGKKDEKEINKTTNTSMKWLIMIMVPTTIVMSIFGDNLIKILYGTQYEEGALVLILFVVGLFLRSIFILPQAVLTGMKRLDVEIKAIGIAAVVNILLNILFIPMWGINGAALASVLSLMSINLVVWYYSKKIFNFKFPKEAYKPLIAGVIGLIVIFLLKEQALSITSNYISQIHIGQSQGQIADEIIQRISELTLFGVLFGISCLVYFIVLLGLKSFGTDELELLEAGLKKIGIPDEYRKLVRTILEGKYIGSH